MTNKLIEFKISLKRGAYSGKELYENCISKLWFEPEKIYLAGKTNKGFQTYKKLHIELIKETKSDISIVLNTENERFSCVEPAHKNTHQAITIITSLRHYSDVLHIFSTLMKNKEKFIVGYCYDHIDSYLQNAKYESDFEVKGLKPPYNEFILDDKTGFKILDTSNNPGRMTLVSYMWLSSCWQMWFGKEFYRFINKEKLASFKEANKIEELENDIIFIELYENPFKANENENRLKQKKFRDYIELEKIEQELK